jgi:hypothetical protein
MGLEEFFDPFAVESKLFFNRKKHFHETQGQHAFGGLGASRLFSWFEGVFIAAIGFFGCGRRFALPSIELISWPSGGIVLLDVAARASASLGRLPINLWRLLLKDRDRIEAGRLPAQISPAAELFTTSLRLVAPSRFARLWITPKLISALKSAAADCASA